MRYLNQHSNAILQTLIRAMSTGYAMQLIHKGYWNFEIHTLPAPMKQEGSIIRCFRLSQYYYRDRRRINDPLIDIIVIDTVDRPTVMYPFAFIHADILNQVSVIFRDHQTVSYDRHLQGAHAIFTDAWLANLEKQGFFDELNLDQ